jgi:hypothetical protein
VATVDDPPEVPSVPYVQALPDARGPKASQSLIHDSIWSSRSKVHHWVAGSPRNGRVPVTSNGNQLRGKGPGGPLEGTPSQAYGSDNGRWVAAFRQLTSPFRKSDLFCSDSSPRPRAV